MVSDMTSNTTGLEKRVNKIEDKLLSLQVRMQTDTRTKIRMTSLDCNTDSTRLDL